MNRSRSRSGSRALASLGLAVVVLARRPEPGRGRAARRRARRARVTGSSSWRASACSRKARTSRNARCSPSERPTTLAALRGRPRPRARAGCRRRGFLREDARRRRRRARAGGAVPDPLARAEPGRLAVPDEVAAGLARRRRAGRAGAASTTLEVGGVLTVFPEGNLERRGLADAPHPPVRRRRRDPGSRGLGARGLRRVLEGVHARRLPGRPVPAGHQAAAVPVPPVDVRRRSTAPGRCSVPRPARSPSSRSWSTTTASSAPQSDFDEPVGPGFWNRDR